MLPESQASQSHPRVFDSSTLLHPAGPAGSAGTAGSCSLTANSKATESEKWRNAGVVRPLHWLRYGFAIARNWILLATAPAPTVPTPGLLSYCTRTVPYSMFLPCHAILESANKGRTSSSQPRASPDSCHPDTFSMKINKDPKDARFG